MRMTVLLALLALTIGACKDDRSLGADFQSGSRLKARFWVAPGGAEVLADWYDTELGVQCRPGRASDGVLRCLPVRQTFGWAAVGPGPQIADIFADTACTQRLGLWTSDCEPPPYKIVRQPDPCEPHDDVYPVTGVSTPTELFSRDPVTGECASLGAPSLGRGYLTLGAAVAPATFVALEPVAVGDGGRLRQRFYQGSDGTLMLRDVYDATLDTPCSLRVAADGQLRCLPETETLWEHADSQCQTLMVTWGTSDDGCALPDYRYGSTGDDDGDMCTYTERIFPLGPAEAGVTSYVDHTGTCEPNGPPPGFVGDFYGWTAGAELSPATFVAADPQPLRGDGRIRRSLHTDDQGFVLREGLWDELLQTPCTPQPAPDTTTRCQPTAQGIVTRTYADATCSTELPSVRVQYAECLSPGELRYATEQTDDCPPTHRVFEVGAPLDASTLYELDGEGACREAIFAGQYSLGAEIPASQLVELTLEQR